MFISTIQELESIPKFKEAGIEAVIVAVPTYSIRTQQTIDWTSLKRWKEECDRNGLKLYINMMKFIMEEELDDLREKLAYIKELDLDGIYYGDEALYYEAKQLGIEQKLIYQPETLVTSDADVSFYESLGIQAISLAHELSLEEIVEISKRSDAIEILIHGYFSILYSRRPLVDNYLHHLGQENEKKTFELIESTREERMPILQDESGTYVFSSQPIQSFDQIRALHEAKIQRFRIDSIFMNDDDVIELVQAYQDRLNGQPIDPTWKESGSDRWYKEKTVKKKENICQR